MDNFDYYLRHNCLWIKKRLIKIEKSEDCGVCKKEAESTRHMFFKCDKNWNAYT